MKEYFIFHPESGRLNHRLSKIGVTKHVAIIKAHNLEDAFKLSQNDFNEEYAKLGVRSTSVGDIIVEAEKHYMVMGLGFTLLD